MYNYKILILTVNEFHNRIMSKLKEEEEDYYCYLLYYIAEVNHSFISEYRQIFKYFLNITCSQFTHTHT